MSDVLELPVSERLELVGDIWDSIAQAPDAVELTEAQRVELERRLEAYRRDPNAGSPWSEVKARILSSR
jgi:putative addiction module component (TIGR02574 family)